MLRDLVVENLGVIERADLELERGSNALTGETGAGKTLLVSALALLLGARSDRSLIRAGAREARVEARFELPPGHPALGVVSRLGVDVHDGELVVSRTLSGSGGKIRVNGSLVPLSALAELGPQLVEIAGQNEHQSLGSRRRQLQLLDSFAGPRVMALAAEVATAVSEAARLKRAADELIAGERERERELDRLRYELAEIEAAAPAPDETEALKVEAARLEHAETIATSIARTRVLLEREGGAGDLVREAASLVAKITDRDPALAGPLQRLESAAVELDDIVQELAARVPTVDPSLLEETRQRIAELARLQRKYGGNDGAVLAYLAEAREEVASLELAASDVERIAAEAGERQRVANQLARELSALRAEAAPRLATAVQALLGELAMGSTRLDVELTAAELYEGGLETVEIKIGLPGQAPRPIAKVASGGELSRIALALRLASGSALGFASTTVFDEVDAGVGGEAARAVGRCLAELAERSGVQVLVVTHLPQVAAFADAHYRVERVLESGSAKAIIEALDDDARVAEVSRMLAGLPDSELAREHAIELLEIAGSR